VSKLTELSRLGQSIWYDNIRRALIDSGELQALLDDGVVGVTSNPSIFEKAIAGSIDYDADIRSLAAESHSPEQIYEHLALEDIGRTADLLRPIYDRSDGIDGYVSLEVSPDLAHDTAGTISEARRLFTALDRPNVMIKVPATPAGIHAIEALIGEGIPVNVTLIFSLANYEAVAEAYIVGLGGLFFCQPGRCRGRSCPG
jgi:transaldolase